MSPLTAFDADVLIYAAAPGHPLGARVAALFSPSPDDGPVGVGSVLLMPEILARPIRTAGSTTEVDALESLLARLDLRPVDASTAELAVVVAATYGLHAADAVHLATAIEAGADRFLTNNRRDFSRTIPEIDVVYPEDLPEP